MRNSWDKYIERANQAIDNLLPQADVPPERLHEAIRYSTMNGGKRIRATLVYLTGEVFGAQLAHLDAPATTIELIHASTLVHDDLPAMDDDDMRRGLPSCHIQYDEATAILVGVGLQYLAFKVLADEANGIAASCRSKMVFVLAEAAGTVGMVGGQAMDIAMAAGNDTNYGLGTMHLLKTGMLINASVLLGAIASNKADAESLHHLDEFGRNIGLAFQTADDMLDDENPEFSNRTRALKLRDNAFVALDKLSQDTSSLRRLTDFIVNRTH